MAKKKKVGLDVGHGENTFDTGSKGVYNKGIGYEEHHFNSAVGLIVKARLEELGFEVVMAQEPYKKDIPLGIRAAVYDREDVDIVISLHANAGQPAARGMGVFYYQGSTLGKRLAELFVTNFKNMVEGASLWNRGLWVSIPRTWSDFYILRVPKAPANLIEFAFMTNAHDFELLFGEHKEKFIKQSAEATVKTVCDYFGVKYQEEKKPVEPTPLPKGNYKVSKGDTFYSLARKYKLTVTELVKANPGVDYKNLQIGQYINIPAKVEPKPQPAKPRQPVVEPAPQKGKVVLPSGVYRYGSRGWAVKVIQQNLNKLGFKVGKVDGIYGAKTQDAVKRFQMVYDAYNVDGIYGSRTKARMEKLLNK